MLKLTPARAHLRGHTYIRLKKGLKGVTSIPLGSPSSDPPSGDGESCSIARIRTIRVHCHVATHHTSVCDKKQPPDNNNLGKISLQSAKSGAGEQFLPLDSRAEVHLIRGVFLSQAGITRECKDVVFEDVVFDNNRFSLILYLDVT